MKKMFFAVPLVVVLALPFVTSAHERQVFEINGKQYQVVVGSLGEPVIVDDKSGLDLRVSTLPGEKPVEGLQDSLKVELIAGDKKKELPIVGVSNTPGAYSAVFFPTVATELSYRVFGEIDATPFNVTFTCAAAGHEHAAEDTSHIAVSDGVVRTLKTGAFGCPQPKAEMGFPEASHDLRSLVPLSGSHGLSVAALALATIALALAASKRRS